MPVPASWDHEPPATIRSSCPERSTACAGARRDRANPDGPMASPGLRPCRGHQRTPHPASTDRRWHVPVAGAPS